MDLIYLLKSLLRRKWLIIICTLVAVVLAFLLTMNQPQLYRSVAQIATGFTTNDQVKLREEGFNIYEIDVKFNNVVEAFKSSKVLGLLSYHLMIHDLENPAKSYRKLGADEKQEVAKLKLNNEEVIEILKNKYTNEKLLSSFDPEERRILELVKLYQYDLETIRKFLHVGRVQRTDFIDVVYNSSNPELSAEVVNQICAEFLRTNESSRTQNTLKSIDALDVLVKQKRDILDSTLARLRTKGTIDVSVESSSKLEQISNFENRVADERSALMTAQLGYNDIKQQLAAMDRTSGATTTSAPSTLGAEVAAAKSLMNAAYSDYVNKGSNDPELLAKYKRLQSDYNKKLSQLASVSPASSGGTVVTKADLQQRLNDLEIQIKTAESNIESYNRKISQLNGSIGAAASRGANNIALQKEVDLAQAEYEAVKSRYDAATNSKVAPSDNFRQILFGQPAVEPEPSKRIIILGLAGMSMFVFCCIGIIFLEYIDVSIKTPSQFTKALDLKMLGVVNHVNFKKTTIDHIFDNPGEHARDQSIFREHLRKLRYEIEASNKQVFLVTSARPGEGKSTIIKSLAHIFSLSKKKILLIDSNFNNNSLTREYGAKATLESFQANIVDGRIRNLNDAVSPTNIKNVDIIGCEGGNYTPMEVISEKNLLNYLDKVAKEYDFIFMEGAALNGRSDSMELLQYAESVISVVSAKSTIRQTDKESIQFLQELNGKYTGAVLNNVELQNIDL
ncbi:hypothetical protein COR50_15490 [Chitinophaga caeni]|uniref:non-specific protein-tyrosine kinase n=1 Tax=Chitinophaga caeni TaxID=2029983 RepID=A0A291QX43_9BACT|nr:polysaccharide biosynthesis tyrosine autokinase [Chitinophaga caeni]ATL48452.1 hypothetical protein COR50_15490 [Chitinophaga caeni]